MTHAPAGGLFLRRTRQRLGLTQSELGRVAGVSVRTIRGVERGEIQRPQVATLQQLAVALRLDPRHQAEFLHAFAAEPTVAVEDLLVDPTVPELEQIDAVTRSALGAYRIISQNWHTSVDAHRRMTGTRCQLALEAVEDGLQHVFNIQNGDGQTLAHRMEFVPGHGCSASGRWDFEDSNVTVFGVRLPRPLTKGEVHAYEYEIVTDPHQGQGESDGFIAGAPHTARAIVLSVSFETAPVRVQRLAKLPGRSFEFLGDVVLGEDLHASLVLEDAPPGAHGFAWSW